LLFGERGDEKMERATFEDIRLLFGLPLDAPEVAAFLGRFPEHRISKPSDGAQYVVFRPHGFDLLFRPPAGNPGGRARQRRVLGCVFLFRQGEERHEQFANPPFGVAFADARDELVRKLGEPFASSLTIGLGALGWEKWQVGGLVLHAMYDRTSMTTRTFTVGPAGPEDQGAEQGAEAGRPRE
jgi:hypothetical protein